ncbi:MAG TPA: glycosyltransferase [Crocinitomicaceae bacterium]|nr:glycosyltransferase [Crocinitomicaceae bacterium]
MSKKTVLYLSYDGMTDPLGQSQVLPYLRGLSKAGYDIHLVSYEKVDKFKQHKKVIQKICDEANIKWHPQDYVLGGGLKTTLKQVRKMKKIAFYLHDLHHFNIVHCRSYISALSGLELKRKKGVKFIFDMRGFWADERVDGKIWNLKKILSRTIYNYFKRKEIQFFKEADYTISLTEKGKNEIESWEEFKTEKPRIKVIPCCVDLELFNPKNVSEEEKANSKKELGITEDQFVLGYIGSIGTWYMLSEMLDYFKILKKDKPKSVFLFISGENSQKIKEQAIKKGIDSKDIVVKSVLHSQVPLHISLFDTSIFFIRSTYSKKASSPTKQGEIMAMGIPLVCNAGVGDTDAIVKKHHAGKVIEEFSDEIYQLAVNDSNSFNREDTINGAKDYFSLEEGVKRYLSVYKAIHE